MAKARLMVVDDDAEVLDFLCGLLEEDGYEVMSATDGMGAIRLMQENCFSVVLIDLKLPDCDGINVLRCIKEIEPNTVGIVFTGYGSIESAVEAMAAGAFHYLTKPFKINEVRSLLKKALRKQGFDAEGKEEEPRASRGSETVGVPGEMIGQSRAIQQVFQLIKKVADTDSTVLIYGESGTGKELVAQTIHFNSRRKEGPFIPVNCGAIPESLLESELFGHEKGAFTGANTTRPGRFELANGGTIFLDEIGNMCPAMQVKILRVLQERKFERLGGVKTVETDVRVIAATNRDLEKIIEEGKFREDLFYRLNVIPIVLPPLRERDGDLALLVSHFLKKFTALRKKNVEGFSFEALSLMERYPWPGNVRELENMIDRLVVLKGEGIISPHDLPDKIRNGNKNFRLPVPEIPEGGLCLEEMMKSIEKGLILKALERSNWVKQRAADLLHVNRTTLVEKIKKNGLKREQPADCI